MIMTFGQHVNVKWSWHLAKM